MEYVVICVAAFFFSTLTLFTGFGLGTLLLPAFALFFPISVAVSLTAIVHLINNLVKLSFLGRHADREVILKFGLPAIPSAFAGAWALFRLSDLKPLFTYELWGRPCAVEPVKLVIAALILLFALIEALPQHGSWVIERKFLPWGGVLSGFFGGLSGHQGAFRSAFLIHLGLTKESFIGSGAVIACLIDLSRIFVYGTNFLFRGVRENAGLLLAVILSAFLGVWVGSGLLKTVTIRTVQLLVSILLTVIAAGLASGIL
jgi:hypothetical protein